MNIKVLPAKIVSAVFVILCAACTGSENTGGISHVKEIAPAAAVFAETAAPADTAVSGIAESLEQIAELERAGGFFPGLGLAESELRERAGDYAGALVAAYKEISWAYGCGTASMSHVQDWLQSALALFENISSLSDPQRSAWTRAANGCIAFVRGDWEKAEELLAGILSPSEEPDSFLRWMLLVCALEQDKSADESRAARSAYGAIRARYALFPEYWYRGARNIGAAYAEQCINTSPHGPFAGDSRSILAGHFGISPDGKDIRTKSEIEDILRTAASVNNPKILEELFPLMALPDNPYTVYALGAMQALASIPEFRMFFTQEALKSTGRLGERLNYISRS